MRPEYDTLGKKLGTPEEIQAAIDFLGEGASVVEIEAELNERTFVVDNDYRAMELELMSMVAMVHGKIPVQHMTEEQIKKREEMAAVAARVDEIPRKMSYKERMRREAQDENIHT